MFSQNMQMNKQMLGKKENYPCIPTGLNQNHYLLNFNIMDKNGNKIVSNSQTQKGEIKKYC